jgi:5S rRNA maturation endonuclease (ribonuclease M5)
LSTRLKEKHEKIIQALDALAEESAKGTPIIVEGKKDTEALRSLGVEGQIVTAKTGGRNFLDVVSEVEQLCVGEVILFLDFDRRGKEGTKLLKQCFERAKIKPVLSFWRELFALVGHELRCVEGLAAYLDTLRVKAGVSAE